MTGVQKLTISVPSALAERIEAHRAALGLSRSELMVDLMWRGWRELEQESREQQHRTAYAIEVDGGEEPAWADLAADEMFAPQEPSKPKRRAAG